jgi:hypothetical protein
MSAFTFYKYGGNMDDAVGIPASELFLLKL